MRYTVYRSSSGDRKQKPIVPPPKFLDQPLRDCKGNQSKNLGGFKKAPRLSASIDNILVVGTHRFRFSNISTVLCQHATAKHCIEHSDFCVYSKGGVLHCPFNFECRELSTISNPIQPDTPQMAQNYVFEHTGAGIEHKKIRPPLQSKTLSQRGQLHYC